MASLFDSVGFSWRRDSIPRQLPRASVDVGGRKLSDQERIINLAQSSKHLLDLVRRREFKLDKATFCDLHAHVARNERLE